VKNSFVEQVIQPDHSLALVRELTVGEVDAVAGGTGKALGPKVSTAASNAGGQL
jgi:hypothetical protein